MRILYVEPFESGSHAAFTQTLTSALPAQWMVLTLPGRHWKWRMRGCAAWFATEHAEALRAEHDLLVASSFVPLAELVGLVPELSRIPRVLYFHENQLAYPSQGRPEERDQHFGFTQMVSGLAATRCVFNSAYNRDSFLETARRWLSKMPDARPRRWVQTLAERSEVLPYPVALPERVVRDGARDRSRGPLLLWNHRWEFDKDPETFFRVMSRLARTGAPFRLAVCGESFRRIPESFGRARIELAEHIEHSGTLPTRAAYEAMLSRADVAISTALHEFFGVAMIEAAHFGARPLVPDRLAYPEVFDASCRYRDEDELFAKLRELCESFVAGDDVRWPGAPRLRERFGVDAVIPRFQALFDSLVHGA